MSNLSLKNLVIIAVITGLAVGIVAAFAGNVDFGGREPAVAQSGSKDDSESEKLSNEVLKALPPEQLAEMYPEKAEAILNPESAEQFKSAGSKSDDPEYLRAVLEKLGADPPEDATTKQLQEMLAHVETQVVDK